MIILCIAGIAYGLFCGIHLFLAINDPVKSDVLIVEGWVEHYALEFATKEFRTRGCKRLYTTGVPITQGSYLVDYKTFADLGAATLRELGVPADAIIAVPPPAAQVDRTYHSVVALQQFFAKHGGPPTAFNVVTIGAHARRSRLIYRQVFGDTVNIGVIAVPNFHYDSRRWWLSSIGLRDVIGETLAYVYARVLGP